MALNDKQELFCQEYLVDLNATKAAIRAGYSEASAAAIGHENLTKPEISARVAELKAERMEATKVDAQWVLRRLVNEAEADVADLYDDVTGALKPPHEWPEIWRKGLVAGIEVDAIGKGDDAIGTTTKIKLSDRIKRIELIGKHIDIMAFATRIEATGKDGGPIETTDPKSNDLARRLAFALTEAGKK